MDIPKVLYVQSGTLIALALCITVFGAAPNPSVYVLMGLIALVFGILLGVLGNVGWRWRSPLYRPTEKETR